MARILRRAPASADIRPVGRIASLINLTDGFIVKITSYRNYTLAVLTRDEHCPPHVHVGSSEWDARPGAKKIVPARFDAADYATTLCFEGESAILEIEHGKD